MPNFKCICIIRKTTKYDFIDNIHNNNNNVTTEKAFYRSLNNTTSNNINDEEQIPNKDEHKNYWAGI